MTSESIAEIAYTTFKTYREALEDFTIPGWWALSNGAKDKFILKVEDAITGHYMPIDESATPEEKVKQSLFKAVIESLKPLLTAE
jgi:hypothetical protein